MKKLEAGRPWGGRVVVVSTSALACAAAGTQNQLCSADKADAFLFARLGFRLRLCRQLQYAGRLAFAQQSEQHGAPVGKLERIMMRGQLFLVDLAEDRRLMIDSLGLPAKQARWQTGDFACECEFGARHQTHRHAEIVDVGKTARSGTEITSHKLVAYFRRPRPHALEAKVTHLRLLSPGMVSGAFNAPHNPSGNKSKQKQCRHTMDI